MGVSEGQDSAWHQTLGSCVLCWLATVDAQGQPQVSPKEVFAVSDEQHVVIAHIASPTSVKNVLQNPKVCVSLIDVFVQKGWKLLGLAQYVHSSNQTYGVRPATLDQLFS